MTQRFRIISSQRLLLRPLVPQPGAVSAAMAMPVRTPALQVPTLSVPSTPQWLHRRARVPYWVAAIAIATSLAGAAALPLSEQVPHSAASAAPTLAGLGLSTSARDSAWPTTATGTTIGGATTSAGGTNEIATLQSELSTLSGALQQAQRESASLRDSVTTDSHQLDSVEQQQTVATDQYQDQSKALAGQAQAQTSQLQGQLAGQVKATQDRLNQLAATLATVQKLDNDLRGSLKLSPLSAAPVTVPDLAGASDPAATAQDTLNALQAQLDSVSSDLQTVSAKIDQQNQLRLEAAAQATAAAKAQQAAKATAATGQMLWPTSGTITQPFGPTSLTGEPAYLGYAHFHQGIDIANNMYTPILAADGGTVIYAGWTNAGYGNMVEIDHGNGLVTLYGHMATTPMVSVGQKVAKGQQIGQMGSTGYSTGPHCHFAVLRNGAWVNPANYLP